MCHRQIATNHLSNNGLLCSPLNLFFARKSNSFWWHEWRWRIKRWRPPDGVGLLLQHRLFLLELLNGCIWHPRFGSEFILWNIDVGLFKNILLILIWNGPKIFTRLFPFVCCAEVKGQLGGNYVCPAQNIAHAAHISGKWELILFMGNRRHASDHHHDGWYWFGLKIRLCLRCWSWSPLALVQQRFEPKICSFSFFASPNFLL